MCMYIHVNGAFVNHKRRPSTMELWFYTGALFYGYKSNTVQHTIGQELPSYITYFDCLLTFFVLPEYLLAHSCSLVG